MFEGFCHKYFTFTFYFHILTTMYGQNHIKFNFKHLLLFGIPPLFVQ